MFVTHWSYWYFYLKRYSVFEYLLRYILEAAESYNRVHQNGANIMVVACL